MKTRRKSRRLWQVRKAVRRVFRPQIERLESRELLSITYPTLQNVVWPSSNPTLPAGMDTFNPPVSVQTPASGAPGLATCTPIGNPGDAMALTGSQFSAYTGTDVGKDTNFLVYGQTTAGNGTLANGSILQLDGQQASATLPGNLPTNSMYLVWAQNANGASYPLAVNQTTA
jgi:hypothetical protein